MTDKEKKLIVELAPIVQQQLPKGLFLCVDGGTPNTMTIGWGGTGIFWGKPVFTVPIRPQRFTYPLIQKAQAFIISVPDEGALLQERMQAGTWSGRDGDKFKRLGLETVKGRVVDAPAIKSCKWQIECVVKAAVDLTTDNTSADVVSAMYPARDFHTLFMGEIVACYETER
ncbi:MAG: flavin reductase family protein [Oscillospiraceae bacterium]|jgi:flavin reductase (DIM6/NTAB) family NADH-FMN oxidoreductase RutF|nr:flavin reductase family protein [Oscillospiraceae bacterium]